MADKKGRRLSPIRLFGLIGALFLIVGLMVGGGGAWVFFHVPTFVFTFGVAFFLMLATFGKEFLLFIPDSIVTLISSPTEPNDKFARIAQAGGRYVIGAGVMGAMVGLVQMLQNLSDPSQIGAGMAVAILCPLYAVIASEIFFALLHKAYSGGTEQGEGIAVSYWNVALPSGIVALMVILTMILIVTFR